ncbi:MAG: transcription antitermination factor NusB [Phycisphaeraceae bacterium]|nr:MAG: transcription antitermination factor NusB [Phycisphaeraceae bacterium]
MSTPREVRTLAFQMLFQLDAGAERGDLGAFAEAGEADAASVDRAVELACAAYEARATSDAAMLALAPGWPAHRQPAVDRALLRLAHFELTSGRVSAAVIINEAVELAKQFGTEKSPAFVNALLDRVAKGTAGEAPAGALAVSEDIPPPA